MLINSKYKHKITFSDKDKRSGAKSTLILLATLFEHAVDELLHWSEFSLFYQIKLSNKVDKMLEACVQMCLQVCVRERQS